MYKNYFFIIALISIFFLAADQSHAASGKTAKAEKYLDAGDIERALEEYNKLINKYTEKDPEIVKEAEAGIANARVLEARNEYNKDNLEEALIKYEKILEVYKENQRIKEVAQQGIVDVWFRKADKELDDKKPEKAVENCKKALEVMPEDAETVTRCEKIMERIGSVMLVQAEKDYKDKKYSAAALNYEKAIELIKDPAKQADYKYKMAYSLMQDKKYEKAVAVYDDITENHTDDKETVIKSYKDKYSIYRQQENKDLQLYAINSLAELMPGDSELMIKRAELLENTGETELSKEAYEKVLLLLKEEDKNTFLNKEIIQYKLGMIYLKLKRYNEATVEFNKALNRKKDMNEARVGLAAAYFKNKSYESAIKTYGDLISDYEKDFKKLELKLIKEKDSIEIAKTLEEMRTELARFHYYSGLSYEALGQYDKALEECRKGFEGVSTTEAAETQSRIQKKLEEKRTK